MINTNYQQFIYSATIFIFVFIGLYLIKPDYHFIPHGIVLFSKASEPSIKTTSKNPEVSLSEKNNQFAVIRVEYYSKTESEEASAKLLDYVKAHAEKFDPDKVVVNYFGYNPMMSTLIMEASVLREPR